MNVIEAKRELVNGKSCVSMQIANAHLHSNETAKLRPSGELGIGTQENGENMRAFQDFLWKVINHVANYFSSSNNALSSCYLRVQLCQFEQKKYYPYENWPSQLAYSGQ